MAWSRAQARRTAIGAALGLIGSACAQGPALAQQEGLEPYRAKALRGDAGSQRTLAGCLGEEPAECPVELRSDPIEACAWRMIVVAAKPPDAGDADMTAYERDCGYQTISQLEQVAALALAEKLFPSIYGREMPLDNLLRP